MSETILKPTPGEWEWYGRGGIAILSGGKPSQSLNVVCIVDNDGHRAPNPADKALIAAAPDLLAVVEKIVFDYEHGDGETQLSTIRRAYDAIAKAKGQS